jgi:bacteriocin-type transport-associated protein
VKKVLYILGQLGDSDTDWLAKVGRRQKTPVGHCLIEEGKPIDALYIVLTGRFGVSAGGKPLAELGKGEILGELSFVDASPPVATVRAIEDGLVLAVPRAQLEARLKQDLGFAARFYRAIAIFLAGRLRATMQGLGYGGGSIGDRSFSDELDDSALEDVSMAGKRFEWLLEHSSKEA